MCTSYPRECPRNKLTIPRGKIVEIIVGGVAAVRSQFIVVHNAGAVGPSGALNTRNYSARRSPVKTGSYENEQGLLKLLYLLLGNSQTERDMKMNINGIFCEIFLSSTLCFKHLKLF